jgi:hypothetical protein
MSKLPTDFVKAPVTHKAPVQPKPRRTRKSASLISPEPVKDPRELLLHLTDEEFQALEDARQKLHSAGTEVTLEQMIHRVFAEWMLRARAAMQPAPQPSEAAAPRRDEHLTTRLRAFVKAPLRMWRELGTQMWRRYARR